MSLQEMGLCPYPPPAVASWSPCNETFCLFNVSADPCEHKNLAEEMPEVVESIKTDLRAQGLEPNIELDMGIPTAKPVPKISFPSWWRISRTKSYPCLSCL